MVTNADCTVFNRYLDKTEHVEKYKRTVLRGVFWDETRAANVVTGGLNNADAATVLIPFRDGYCPPVDWEKNAPEGFTLRPGDRIVKGEIVFSGTMAELSKQFDSALTITGVDVCDYGSSDMQHWEVGCG